jgi:hypothetical protein
VLCLALCTWLLEDGYGAPWPRHVTVLTRTAYMCPSSAGIRTVWLQREFKE